MKPIETDWKLLNAMLPEIREAYLAKTNERAARILTASDKSPTECFWEAKEVMDEQSKILQLCMDGLSRSRLEEKVFLLCRYGILNEERLSRFSEELQNRWRNHNRG
jgi:hypothetical protein